MKARERELRPAVKSRRLRITDYSPAGRPPEVDAPRASPYPRRLGRPLPPGSVHVSDEKMASEDYGS
ncbi:MAG: hypothetical protein IPP07_08870 [Holophagales bacterium]|nr:hypothetical protein [Holophagales bacterium]